MRVTLVTITLTAIGEYVAVAKVRQGARAISFVLPTLLESQTCLLPGESYEVTLIKDKVKMRCAASMTHLAHTPASFAASLKYFGVIPRRGFNPRSAQRIAKAFKSRPEALLDIFLQGALEPISEIIGVVQAHSLLSAFQTRCRLIALSKKLIQLKISKQAAPILLNLHGHDALEKITERPWLLVPFAPAAVTIEGMTAIERIGMELLHYLRTQSTKGCLAVLISALPPKLGCAVDLCKQRGAIVQEGDSIQLVSHFILKENIERLLYLLDATLSPKFLDYEIEYNIERLEIYHGQRFSGSDISISKQVINYPITRLYHTNPITIDQTLHNLSEVYSDIYNGDIYRIYAGIVTNAKQNTPRLHHYSSVINFISSGNEKIQNSLILIMDASKLSLSELYLILEKIHASTKILMIYHETPNPNANHLLINRILSRSPFTSDAL